MDPSSNSIIVADQFNNCLRKVCLSSGVVSTLAGVVGGGEGHVDGALQAARFCMPSGVCMDPSSNSIIVADGGNNCLRKVCLSSGVVSTLAGVVGGGQGHVDGTLQAACFNDPTGVCIDPSSNSIIVADYGNHSLRQIGASPKLDLKK